jgi:hypothetical protein
MQKQLGTEKYMVYPLNQEQHEIFNALDYSNTPIFRI